MMQLSSAPVNHSLLQVRLRESQGLVILQRLACCIERRSLIACIHSCTILSHCVLLLILPARQLAHVQTEQVYQRSSWLPCEQLPCAQPGLSRPSFLNIDTALNPESATDVRRSRVDVVSFPASTGWRMQVQMLVETRLYELKSAIASW